MPDRIANLILTRPKAASDRFIASLSTEISEKVGIIRSPLIEIVGLPAQIDWNGVRGVIFSSSNGVRYAGPGRGLPAYCVGTATTEAAREAGWDAIRAGRDADELVQFLIEAKPPSPLLHLAGVYRWGDVHVRLNEQGIAAQIVEVYDQQLRSLNKKALAALQSGLPMLVPLFSPRTAKEFAAQYRGTGPLHLVAISDQVMNELADLHAVSRDIADEPTADAVRDAVAGRLRRVEARRAPQ